MHDWPVQGDTEIPSPELVSAWLTLNTLPTERVPFWAAHWLVAGYDGEALIELAGLSGNDPHDVRDLLHAALIECAVPAPDLHTAERDRERAAAMTAFTALAKLHAEGRASERWVVQKVYEIAEPYFHDYVTSLPLGHLFGLDDEWSAGWGRTDDQLRTAVRQACREQLRAALGPGSGLTPP